MRALQITCIPDGAARQNLSDRLEHDTVAGVAAEVLLPVDAAVILADRRMANPPPSCRDCPRFVCIGHRQIPSILSVAVRQSTHRLQSLCQAKILGRLKSCLNSARRQTPTRIT